MSYKKTVIGQRKKPFEEAIQKIKEFLYRKLNSTIGLNPETFCRISWAKEITISEDTGYVINDPEIAHRWKDKQKVYEQRKLYLYSPWIIETHFWYSGPSKRIVVNYDGNEEIETHKFSYHVVRKKFLWWGLEDAYRVVHRSDNDNTEFERDLDAHLTREQY